MINLDYISSLRFKNDIIINSQKLFRGHEPRDLNTLFNFWEYTFYDVWDTEKSLLPSTSHIVRVYVDFQPRKVNGKEVWRESRILRATISKIATDYEEEIVEISKC